MHRIPLNTDPRITVVTSDLRGSAKAYSRFFGIGSWDVRHHTEERLAEVSSRGLRPTARPNLDLATPSPLPNGFSFVSAIGRNATGGACFELVQPTGGLSTFEEFLITRGMGVHSVAMTVVGQREFEALREWLASLGVTVAQSYRFGQADWYYFGARHLLGSFYVTVIVPQTADFDARTTPDEVWTFPDDLLPPPACAFGHQVSGITHLGVVVPSLMDVLPGIARLFGVPLWRGTHWRTSDGSLEDTTYNGKPVVHGYLTGRADFGKNSAGVPFGLEIIQPVSGKSHYKEDFLDLVGPGVHHIDLKWPIESWVQWDAMNAWMAEEFAAPTCMSGWLRNRSILFHYQDARKTLGTVVETHPPLPPDGTGKLWAPDYWFDYSGLTGM